MRLHGGTDHVGDVQEADIFLQICCHRHLIGCVEGRRHSSADPERLVSQPGTWKPLVVRPVECQRSDACQIQRRRLQRHAFRIIHRVRNRRPHVGQPQLGDHRTVPVFYQRMDDALPVNQHLDLRGRDIEQPPGFNHLEPFVHERGGIDRDLRAHLPVGMPQRLLGLHVLHLLAGQLPQRAAGSGQNQASDVLAAVPFH